MHMSGWPMQFILSNKTCVIFTVNSRVMGFKYDGEKSGPCQISPLFIPTYNFASSPQPSAYQCRLFCAHQLTISKRWCVTKNPWFFLTWTLNSNWKKILIIPTHIGTTIRLKAFQKGCGVCCSLLVFTVQWWAEWSARRCVPSLCHIRKFPNVKLGCSAMWRHFKVYILQILWQTTMTVEGKLILVMSYFCELYNVTLKTYYNNNNKKGK